MNIKEGQRQNLILKIIVALLSHEHLHLPIAERRRFREQYIRRTSKLEITDASVIIIMTIQQTFFWLGKYFRLALLLS